MTELTTQQPAQPPVIGSTKRVFCHELRATGSLRLAVKAAGILSVPGCKSKDPLSMGMALLTDPIVIRFMEHLARQPMHGMHVDSARTREELSALAYGDLGRFLEFKKDANGKSTGELERINIPNGDTRILASIDVQETITKTSTSRKVRLRAHPKIDALKLSGQEAGMFTEETRKAPTVNLQIVLNGIAGAPTVVHSAENDPTHLPRLPQ